MEKNLPRHSENISEKYLPPRSETVTGSDFLSSATIEKLYHRMVDEVSDYAILLLDNEGNILTWNPGAEVIKGYREDEIKGKNFTSFYTAEDRDAGLPFQLLQQARDTGRASHEGWRVKKDGTRFWGNVVITALHDDDGNVVGFSKLTRDLTQRKADEEKLRQSEERYHRMIAEVEDYAIILLDGQGNIVNWNKGAEKIKGYKDSEAIGKNFSIFYLPEDRENGLPNKLLSIAETAGKATHEGWRVRKDGSRFWGSIVITALHDDAGNVVGFSKVTRDLTARKHAEDFILQQNRQLEEFAYIASHDLQEPLRKIIIFGNLLQDNLDKPATALDYLSKITHATDRMGNLIKGILAYSQAKTTPQLLERVDLNEILAEVMTDFELLLAERDGRILTDKLPTIGGISIQMHQLFTNIIGNAFKFCEKKPEIRITSEIIQENNRQVAKIKIADNGVGFETPDAEKIFRMFHRLNTHNPGTGIGLALCKRIAESHGGSISASSVLGEGSVFEIVLPVIN